MAAAAVAPPPSPSRNGPCSSRLSSRARGRGSSVETWVRRLASVAGAEGRVEVRAIPAGWPLLEVAGKGEDDAR